MASHWGTLPLAAVMGLVTFPVEAIDFSVSGFGTVGYARSDQAYTYQRFIDDDGTFKRDTLGGLQLDAKYEKFGATVQFKLAPSTTSDNGYTGTVSWAFVSWRPTNDWLFRAGKQRIPFYIYSQSIDVGVTYDFARLPTEMYSISPDNDSNGLSFVKTWGSENGDFTLEGNWGKQRFDLRYWYRDGLPPVVDQGAVFRALKVEGELLALSYKRNDDTYRVALASADIRLQNGDAVATTYPFVSLAPGIGFYQINPRLPEVPTTKHIRNVAVALGAMVSFDSGFRFIGEFARTALVKHQIDIGDAATRGYASILTDIGKWTPYVLYAFLRSESGQRNLYNAVNNNRVPDLIPDATRINASQIAGADGMLTYDQSSLAFGTAYSFSATSKVKAEYMRSHIGQMSSFVDGPPGSNIRNQNINVFSLSYSVAF